MTAAAIGRVDTSAFCQYECSSPLDGRPGQAAPGCAGVPQPASGPHHSGHHVAHRPAGLGGALAGMARCRMHGGPVTLFVRRSKTRKARAVRVHRGSVQLFINWPANRLPRDMAVTLSTRTALRYVGDGIGWAGLDEESPGTGLRRAGA